MTEQALLDSMTRNTVKQELDGLKYHIADALKLTYRDAMEDYSDIPAAEQAEVYKALLEETFETLKYCGVNIPEIIGPDFFWR